MSAIGDLISSIVNRYVGVWQAAPVLASIESKLVRWFCELFGYPESSGGFLSSGGSIANLTAVVAARIKLMDDDFLEGTIYVSDQGHHSLNKAFRAAGIPQSNIRVVATDSCYRMCVDDLSNQLAEDLAAGKRPLMVVATAGTTNTGAIDPIRQIGEISRRSGAWYHVDAAYGGFFALCDQTRKELRESVLADSITIDPHKGLFVPYGTGCLLVKQVKDLQKAFSMDADYLPQGTGRMDQVDSASISPELSRNERGLRVWLPLKLFGIDAFRRALSEKLDLARWSVEQMEELNRSIPGSLEIVAPPQLSLFAFRWRLPQSDDCELNRKLLDRINHKNAFT